MRTQCYDDSPADETRGTRTYGEHRCLAARQAHVQQQSEVPKPMRNLMQPHRERGHAADPPIDGKCGGNAGSIYEAVSQGPDQQSRRSGGPMTMTMGAIFMFAVNLRHRFDPNSGEDMESPLE
jgi:hypothetical protein